MNVFVKQLEKTFEPNISAQELDRRTNDYFKKYHQLKEKNEKSYISRLTYEQRRSIHGALVKMVSLMNRLIGLTYEIIHERRVNTSSPLIFAPTHIGFYDIQIVFEAIKDHSYLLTNAFDYLQGTFDNIAFSLNGVFYFNSTIKEERKVVKRPKKYNIVSEFPLTKVGKIDYLALEKMAEDYMEERNNG